MPDIEDRLRAIRAGVALALQDRARAEHDLGVAQARLDDALRALSEEFGAGPGDARRLLAEAEDALAAECALAEAALAEAGSNGS